VHEGDLRLAHLPAQQHRPARQLAREVDQPQRDVLQLRALGLDLLHDGVEFLDDESHRGPLAREPRGIARAPGGDGGPPLGVEPPGQPLQPRHQQRHPGQHRVRLLQREGASRVRHGAVF
jgi:hypothetical protein